MEFKRNIRRSLKPAFALLNEKYPSFLQLYKLPPDYEIAFKEFEECAAERLSVLQVIDEFNQKGLKGDEWRKGIVDELKKQPELRVFIKLITATGLGNEETDFNARRRDHISHFVLKLAYADTEEKRRWFIGREVDLFKLRWMYLPTHLKLEFLQINNLNYEMVTEEEKKELCELSYGFISTSLDYYKIPFVNVSDLVKSRKVFLQNAIAFITNEDIISVILSFYRSNLAQSLAFAGRRVHILQEDERIFGILKGAGKKQREVDYTIYGDKDKINIDSIDMLSETSFPPCMQMLHKHLKNEHHLKHSGRQQYGLFLKGIGVTMEDALRFWKFEFMKKIDSENFDKKYAYNIRHNYGKEGKRTNYTPYSCIKIINSSVGPSECHGCPFKHRDVVNVKLFLQKNGVTSIGSQEVLDLMKKGHYQLACGKYFQLKHNVETTITHPNFYFDESQKVLTNAHNIKKETTSKTSSKISEDMWGKDEFDFTSIS